MADIRYTPQRDDFQRPNENPINPPWLRNWGSGVNCQLLSNSLKSTVGNPASSGQDFWSTMSFTGDDIEAWGIFTGTLPQAESNRFGLCDSAVGMNGYICRAQNPVGPDNWVIRKYTNGVATGIASQNAPLPSGGSICLMQLTATHVRVYHSTDGGLNFTLIVSAADTTYRSNLYLHFGGNGRGGGWTGVGGGVPSVRRHPQIYRWIFN